MHDMSFEESCPCGTRIKVFGYESQVAPQVQTWHRTHDKHSNAITKTIVMAKERIANPLLLAMDSEDPETQIVVKIKDFDLINVNVAEPILGAQIGKSLLQTHGEALCRGPLHDNGKPICCIHNPSDHHMVTWEQNWRGDKGMMERLCPLHGVGHPDPDDLTVRTTNWAGTHGCCGCCVSPTRNTEEGESS